MKSGEEAVSETPVEKPARPERKSNGGATGASQQGTITKKTTQTEAALNVGHSVRLSTQLVKQAILKRVQETAESRGIAVPSDILDFQNRADIFFIDANEKQVKIDGAIIVWQE